MAQRPCWRPLVGRVGVKCVESAPFMWHGGFAVSQKQKNVNPELADQLMAFDAFTDIEFNPNRQINCQAAAAALYVSLRQQGKLEEALSRQVP